MREGDRHGETNAGTLKTMILQVGLFHLHHAFSYKSSWLYVFRHFAPSQVLELIFLDHAFLK